jgi:hypothetical protein
MKYTIRYVVIERESMKLVRYNGDSKRWFGTLVRVRMCGKHRSLEADALAREPRDSCPYIFVDELNTEDFAPELQKLKSPSDIANAVETQLNVIGPEFVFRVLDFVLQV